MLKRRDLIKKLEASGFKIDRDDGNHTIYEKDGLRPVQQLGQFLLAHRQDFSCHTRGKSKRPTFTFFISFIFPVL